MQITIDYVYTGIYHVSTVCTITVKVYAHAYKNLWSFSASEPRGFCHLNNIIFTNVVIIHTIATCSK